MSHLTRGAWIEMSLFSPFTKKNGGSHLTRGAWIEIYKVDRVIAKMGGRTSHEVRGLKW